MGTMPGHGLPPRVVARMIRAARADGKCAAVSTLGYVCTQDDGHQSAMHVATNQLGEVADSWIDAPGAWTEADIESAGGGLRDKLDRGDKLFLAFKEMIRRVKADPPTNDFVDVWENVFALVSVMPGDLDRRTALELLSYFITRACWDAPERRIEL